MSATMASTKFTEKELAMHREYMKKYQMHSSDLTKTPIKYKDHYQVLGLERSATHSEIRQAYRKLALKYHPDRNGSREAEEQWDGVPQAYAVLSNPNDRMEYDATLTTRDALVEFYKTYNPAKLDNATIQTIIDGWYGREVELFQMLNAKYEIAPHQGTNKSLERAAASLPEERARSISRDNLASDANDKSALPRTWHDSVASAFCCRGAFSRLFGATYYEVDTKSPGFSNIRGVSETPGQSMQSPAPTAKAPESVLKTKKSSESNSDDDIASVATTADDEVEWTDGAGSRNADCESTRAAKPPVAPPTPSAVGA
ncbi:TPA: hypothetical protein N0F65_006083 [Lagenidium giganteum]|uniref:J domain-containing protein n=1 Tax=Lagenidium giganteum TaxID=4803 RepID=A0AAV2YLV9_9STRA|nr:TPA: hypothetical protein N0F65_006083 [Lagenidium giganteum]